MFAIISDARGGHHLGVKTLCLVDRNISKHYWWVSDQPNIIKRFNTIEEAYQKCDTFKQNNPRVVPLEYALSIMEEQAENIANYRLTATQ